MKFVKITYRIVALKLLSITGLVLMGVYASREKNAPINQKQKRIRQWWLKKVVKIVGLRLITKGEVPVESQSALWVANHVSWLDIPVIGSEGVAFLSKAEVRKWPVIGWLGEKGGTVFIQRGGVNASKFASERIADNIHAGDSVLVFPEATTTDGEDVKRFHARIFAPAIDHGLLVQPIAIRYLDQFGERHPHVEWGNESFFSNLTKILSVSDIHVEISFLPLLNASEFSERKQLAEYAYHQIRGHVTAQKKIKTDRLNQNVLNKSFK